MKAAASSSAVSLAANAPDSLGTATAAETAEAMAAAATAASSSSAAAGASLSGLQAKRGRPALAAAAAKEADCDPCVSPHDRPPRTPPPLLRALQPCYLPTLFVSEGTATCARLSGAQPTRLHQAPNMDTTNKVAEGPP